MADTNPYAAPKSQAEDQRAPQAGHFNAEGRTVEAGRGWSWIADGFALFRRQPGMWILLVVLMGILFVVLGMIPMLGSLANALLFPIFGAGLMLGCKELDQGGELTLNHLFAGFKQSTGDLVVVGVVNLVGWLVIALAVVAVIGGGVFMAVMRGGMMGAGISVASLMLALLLVAGLSVPLYMATWFAPALIVLNGMAPAAALKASFFACLRNWLPFLVYGVVLLVLGVVAVLPAFLGLLVLVPVAAASVYAAYRDIFCAR
jgi:uncharacterized membrane protein